MESLDHLWTDIERAEHLQDILISRATGGASSDAEYRELRSYFLTDKKYTDVLPDFVRTKRDLSQFWEFIKPKFDRYEERRKFIWDAFSKLFEFVEGKEQGSVSVAISTNNLLITNVNHIHREIQRALERVPNDPEGAITLARTILESTCKHIAQQKGIKYDDKSELSTIYKDVSKELNLSPDQHSEDVFKQILGGCSGVVNGLGTLRNRLGDAHGKSQLRARPAPRHAELAVNLAGSMAIFLLETHEYKSLDF